MMNTRTLFVAFSMLANGLHFCLTPLSATEFPTDFSQQGKPATIKVLIQKQAHEVLLEAKGPYEMYNPLNDLLLTQGASTKREWITPSKNGLVWGELIPGNFQI